MPTVRDFFAREAGDYLDRLDQVLEGLDDGVIAPIELHKVARTLRGSAQMAREDAFARVAAALESVARAVVEGRARWDPDLSGRLKETAVDLRALLLSEPDEGGARADASVSRLAGLASATRPLVEGHESDGAFRDFAAREGAAVLATLETALRGLANDPRDREPLKTVLRRQRALMGAARLPSIPVLSEALTAVDEITRMVARLDVPVTGEWLEVYQLAQQVLVPLVAGLQRGENVSPAPALVRLRALREQLIERYGAEEPTRQPPVLTPQDEAGAGITTVRPPTPAVARPAAPSPPPPRAAAPPPPLPRPGPAPRPAAVPPRPAPAPAPAPAAAAGNGAVSAAPGTVVGIEQFVYKGDRALVRVLELRAALEEAVVAGDPGALDLLMEIFDLIEAARK